MATTRLTSSVNTKLGVKSRLAATPVVIIWYLYRIPTFISRAPDGSILRQVGEGRIIVVLLSRTCRNVFSPPLSCTCIKKRCREAEGVDGASQRLPFRAADEVNVFFGDTHPPLTADRRIYPEAPRPRATGSTQGRLFTLHGFPRANTRTQIPYHTDSVLEKRSVSVGGYTIERYDHCSNTDARPYTNTRSNIYYIYLSNERLV